MKVEMHELILTYRRNSICLTFLFSSLVITFYGEVYPHGAQNLNRKKYSFLYQSEKKMLASFQKLDKQTNSWQRQ